MISSQASCLKIRELLPGHLDGALRGRKHVSVSRHLDTCAECRRELERYRKISSLMSRMESAAPPADLALRIRIAASRARATQPWPKRVWSRLGLVVENILEPIAVPATGGVAATLLFFVIVMHHLFVGVPLGAVPNDVPTNLIQPARLESLAPFDVSDSEQTSSPSVLLIEAVVNSRGEAMGYDIISGPQTPAVRRQLDQVLMFSRFRPAMSFGRPVNGGRVVVNFTEIRVKG